MTLNATGISALDQSGGITNFANGFYTGDGSGSINVNLGFTPRYVKVWNITDDNAWEWCEGMPATGGPPATNSVVVRTGSTFSIDTSGLITANGTVVTATEVEYGGNGPGDGTNGTQSVTEVYDNLAVPQLVLASGLNTNAKVYAWIAMA